MVASADLARLVLLADQNDGKAVLVGDWAQLGAVDAGGLFRLLANDHAIELTSARRFHNDWERDASLRLRVCDPAVLAEYEQRGRIFGGDRDQLLDEAFSRWQAARNQGETIVLCAADRATVDELASRCQAARRLAGEVDAGVVAAGEHTLGAGDEIVTCRNDRRLVTTGGGWVRNGDRWTVHSVHPDGGVTVEDAVGRGRLRLPADYVSQHVTLAYAVTIHKAQGITVDHAVVLIDDATSAEGLYVGMTRGRATNTALVRTDFGAPEHGPAPPRPQPNDVLARTLERVTAERSAIEELRDRLARSESLAVLKPRLANLEHWIHENAPLDRTLEMTRLHARRERLATLPANLLTRDGRDVRRQLRQLDQHAEQLRERQQHRLDWFDHHADVIAYRDELQLAVIARRQQLGLVAVETQPEHLVRLLGPVPDGRDVDERRVWTSRSARIEAYREEWNIDPEQLDERPLDGVQYREWEAAGFRQIELARQLDQPVPEHSLERGIAIEL